MCPKCCLLPSMLHLQVCVYTVGCNCVKISQAHTLTHTEFTLRACSGCGEGHYMGSVNSRRPDKMTCVRPRGWLCNCVCSSAFVRICLCVCECGGYRASPAVYCGGFQKNCRQLASPSGFSFSLQNQLVACVQQLSACLSFVFLLHLCGRTTTPLTKQAISFVKRGNNLRRSAGIQAEDVLH